jgi:hypothetical protein
MVFLIQAELQLDLDHFLVVALVHHHSMHAVFY